MPATTTFTQSGNPYIDGVLGDRKWAVNNFTYSFPASGSFYGSPYGNNEPSSGFAQLNASQQAATRAALAMYASVANLSFAEITESPSQHADIRLALSTAPSTAWAYFPTTVAEGGDVWFNPTKYSSPTKGNYQYTTFIHELGHALGLEHPHTGGMPADRDSMEYSVMSYRSYIGGSTTSGYTNETWGFAQSLMMYDIAAIQHMYGANFNTNAGNTTYSWSPTTGEMFINGMGQGAPGGNKIFQTVWDGGGTDTYDFSNYTTNLSVDLRPGQWSTVSTAQVARLHYSSVEVGEGNIGNALLYVADKRSLIEHVVGGSGHDYLRGNDGNNGLRGGAGNDTLDGGEGNDIATWDAFRTTFRISGTIATRTLESAYESDTASSVEVLQFNDGSIVSQTDSIAGQVYRLYDAAFGRNPDPLGFNHWIDLLSGGSALKIVAQNFIASAEYGSKSVSNRHFVEELYERSLNRAPDAAGSDFWTNLLDSGDLDRADVLSAFSESPEHVVLTKGGVDAGLWDWNTEMVKLARVYYAAMDRAPDPMGLQFWYAATAAGMTWTSLIDEFVASDEFKVKYGGLDAQQFVTHMYRDILNRAPDDGGYRYWTGALTSGALDASDVVLGFAESGEHQLLILPLVQDGIVIS